MATKEVNRGITDSLVRATTVGLIALGALVGTSYLAQYEQQYGALGNSSVLTPSKKNFRVLENNTGLSYQYGDLLNRSGRRINVDIDEMERTLDLATRRRVEGRGDPVALVFFADIPTEEALAEARYSMMIIASVSPILAKENPRFRV